MDLVKLPTITKGQIRVVVETPRGAAAKLAYQPKAHVFEYARPLPVGSVYPYDWGFIPSTLGEDGDPLDDWSSTKRRPIREWLSDATCLAPCASSRKTRAKACATIGMSSARIRKMPLMSRRSPITYPSI